MAETGKPKEQNTQEIKPETVEKVEDLKQPRELTPEELKDVAGGPFIWNN